MKKWLCKKCWVEESSSTSWMCEFCQKMLYDNESEDTISKSSDNLSEKLKEKETTVTDCDSCQKEISVFAKRCPYCQSDITNFKVKCRHCSKALWQTDLNCSHCGKGFNYGIIFGVIIAFVIVMFVVMWWFSNNSTPTSKTKESTVENKVDTNSSEYKAREEKAKLLKKKVYAELCAKEYVKWNLKSPSTADFPWVHTDDTTEYVSWNNFVVKSYVDSENSFGWTIRTKFTCRVESDEESNSCYADCYYE